MNKSYKNFIIVLSLALFIPGVSFADVEFSELETNGPLSSGAQLGTSDSNPNSLMGDFFAALDAYETQSASASSNTPVSDNEDEGSATNVLAFNNFVPNSDESEASNSNQTISSSGEQESSHLVLAQSASETSGGYGEVIRYDKNYQGQNFQASVFQARSGNSNSFLNNGGLLLLLLLLLLLVFLARRFFFRSSRRYPRPYTKEDRFHDMSRYHPDYRYRR